MRQVGWTFWFLPIALMLAGCDDGQTEVAKYTGYVEAERVFVSAPASGWIVASEKYEGDQVDSGDIIFRLDADRQEAQLGEAKAKLNEAIAQVTDLGSGARKEELAVIYQQRREALAELSFAKTERVRIRELVTRNAAAQARLDRANSDYDTATAKVRRLSAEIKAAELAGRDAQQAAAVAAKEAAEHAVEQAQWDVDQRTVKARVSGRVDEVYYRAGEYVATAAPVVSLISPQALKVRFFIPQSDVPQFHLGSAVSVKPDGAASALEAKVTYIADEAEFTPPVIFSNATRDKLVFMLEAKLTKQSAEGLPLPLRPGLPVDVRRP